MIPSDDLPGMRRILRTIILGVIAGLMAGAARAQQLAGQLQNDYERLYYSGLVAERRARAHLDRGGAIPHGAYDWLMDALDYFERAEAVRPPGNDDAILRWNTCVRLLKKHPELGPSPAMREEPLLLE